MLFEYYYFSRKQKLFEVGLLMKIFVFGKNMN